MNPTPLTPFTSYDQLPVILSVEQMACVLGIGRNTAYELVRSRKVKSIRAGRQIRITKEALLEFLTGD